MGFQVECRPDYSSVQNEAMISAMVADRHCASTTLRHVEIGTTVTIPVPVTEQEQELVLVSVKNSAQVIHGKGDANEPSDTRTEFDQEDTHSEEPPRI